MENSLEARGRALEDQFFHKESEAQLAHLREEQQHEQDLDALRKATGMEDAEVLEKLLATGVKASTAAAISLVPLIAVAWADGTVQTEEREAILQAAEGKGIQKDSPAAQLLSAWLDKQPSADLLGAWEAYVKTLCEALTDGQRDMLQRQVVDRAKLVAEVAGGILGFKKTASSEQGVIERLHSVFAA